MDIKKLECDICHKKISYNDILIQSELLEKCTVCGLIVCDSHSQHDLSNCKKQKDHDLHTFHKCIYCDLEFFDCYNTDDSYDEFIKHLFKIHHIFRCRRGCSKLLKNRDEQLEHLLADKDCLDYMIRDHHGQLLIMIMKILQNTRKDITILKKKIQNNKN